MSATRNSFEGLDLIHGTDVTATDVARELGPSTDWQRFAAELGIPEEDAHQVGREYPGQETLTILRIWLELLGPRATAEPLEKALKRLGRPDVAKKLFGTKQTVPVEEPMKTTVDEYITKTTTTTTFFERPTTVESKISTKFFNGEQILCCGIKKC